MKLWNETLISFIFHGFGLVKHWNEPINFNLLGFGLTKEFETLKHWNETLNHFKLHGFDLTEQFKALQHRNETLNIFTDFMGLALWSSLNPWSIYKVHKLGIMKHWNETLNHFKVHMFFLTNHYEALKLNTKPFQSSCVCPYEAFWSI